jgi:hypothetical protein
LAVLDGALYALDSVFGSTTRLLSIDVATGNATVLAEPIVDVPNGNAAITNAEGLAAGPDGSLRIAYQFGSGIQSLSDRFGQLNLSGEIIQSGSIAPFFGGPNPEDMDALGYIDDTTWLTADAGGQISIGNTSFFQLIEPLNIPTFALTSISRNPNDIALAGGDVWTIDSAGVLRRIDPVSAAVLGQLNFNAGQRVLTGLAVASLDCPEDLTGDGTVGLGDLLQLLASFGRQGLPAFSRDGDTDGDGRVELDDLLTVLAAFGEDCSNL